MKMWRKFYECECSTEGIMLSYEDTTSHPFTTIDIAFFQQGVMSRFPLSFKAKLRYIWHILRTGQPFSDLIMLDQTTAKKLSSDLLRFAKKDFTKGD